MHIKKQKSPLDTHFAYISISLKAYWQAGNDVDNAGKIHEALTLNHISNSRCLHIHMVLPVRSGIPAGSKAKLPFPVGGSATTSHVRWTFSVVEIFEQSGNFSPHCGYIQLDMATHPQIVKWRAKVAWDFSKLKECIILCTGVHAPGLGSKVFGPSKPSLHMSVQTKPTATPTQVKFVNWVVGFTTAQMKKVEEANVAWEEKSESAGTGYEAKNGWALVKNCTQTRYKMPEETH